MKLTNFLKKLTVILNKIPDEEYATQLQDSACAGFDAIKAFGISQGKSELWIQRNLERVLDEAAAKVEANFQEEDPDDDFTFHLCDPTPRSSVRQASIPQNRNPSANGSALKPIPVSDGPRPHPPAAAHAVAPQPHAPPSAEVTHTPASPQSQQPPSVNQHRGAHGEAGRTTVIVSEGSLLSKIQYRTVVSRNTSIGQKRAATPMFAPSPDGLGFSFVHVFDPRAIFDVAQWGGDPYYAPLYYFRMRSMVEEFIPSRFHNERKKAYQIIETIFADAENADDKTNMQVIGDKIVGLFARIYGPEKGWLNAGQGQKTYHVGDFRDSAFFEALDQSLQALIRKRGQ